MSDDQQYYARRSQQERDTADRCGDVGSRRIHTELANRYAEMARQKVPVAAAAHVF